jgi:hypothetical protein
MFISGIWHGAGLTFVVWGLLHGLGSILSHIIEDIVNSIRKINLKKIRRFYIIDFFIFVFKSFFYILGWSLTFIFINITWIFFNSRSIESAMNYLNGILHSNVASITLVNYTLFAVIFIVLLFNFIGDWVFKYSEQILIRLRLWVKLIIVIVLVYFILSLGPDIVPPFIYFNF